MSRAPTRIDLGGGWTDVPPYCDREGGFVCNVAIDRCAHVRVTSSGDGNVFDSGADEPLVRAAARAVGASSVRLRVRNDFPVGSGLGGSSAASAAVFAALRMWRGEDWDPAAIAEAGRRIEVEELGIAGGRQDHYAATHGGALALTFNGHVTARRIPLSAAVRAEIAERFLLVYTGQSRTSGDTITAVLGAYQAGETRVVHALQRMRDLAEQMAVMLEKGDLDAVGGLVGEHWEHQRSLHPSIPTRRIDEIVASSRSAGALGAKAMGASGGGCVLVIAPRDRVEPVRSAIQALGELLAFQVDEAGLVAHRTVA